MENLSFNYCSCPTLTGIDGYGSSGCSACADSPSGKRISKTVDGTTIYTICFDPTMDFDQNGNIIARYVQNPTMLDEPISIESAQGKFYYLFDGLGSVTGLTDSGGSLVATYSYDAFGNIVSETGDATLNAINPYRFTSRVWDKESGLYYYRARYYDAGVGRFISKDPLRSELREGKNLYVYVGNNPVNFVDPTGMVLSCGLWAFGIALGTKLTYENKKTDKWAHCYACCEINRYPLCPEWETRQIGKSREFLQKLTGESEEASAQDIAANEQGISCSYSKVRVKHCFWGWCWHSWDQESCVTCCNRYY